MEDTPQIPEKVTPEDMDEDTNDKDKRSRTQILESIDSGVNGVVNRLDMILYLAAFVFIYIAGYFTCAEEVKSTLISVFSSLALVGIAFVIKRIKDKFGVDLSHVVRKHGLKEIKKAATTIKYK